MQAIKFAAKLTNALNELIYSESAKVSESEVKKLLNYCDELSYLGRSIKTVYDETLDSIQIASFMTCFLQPRFISYDLQDWTCPDLRADSTYEVSDDSEECESSQEFNSICAKIAKRVKINMTTTSVVQFIDEVSIEDYKLKAMVGGKVFATYNYSYLPKEISSDWTKIVGEEMYVKNFNENTFISAFIQNLVSSKTISEVKD